VTEVCNFLRLSKGNTSLLRHILFFKEIGNLVLEAGQEIVSFQALQVLKICFLKL
jgi:hypothetical protein